MANFREVYENTQGQGAELSNINLVAPNGWNQWRFIDSTTEDIHLSDAAFPNVYTPSDAFWVRSIITNCLIPWYNTIDPFHAFLISGGNSGSAVGSASALSVVNALLEYYLAIGEFGLGRKNNAPQMGFAISDKFKQHVWTHFIVENIINSLVLLAAPDIEMLQNSRYKQLYVNHGEVVSVLDWEGSKILDIGIKKDTPPSNIDINGVNIKIVKDNGSSYILPILSLRDDWTIVVGSPSSESSPISAGDFYSLNTTWLIEDPLLLSGLWNGRENDIRSSMNSGMNLFVTTHNKPYQEGKILGVYLLAERRDEVTTNTTTANATTNGNPTVPTSTTSTTTPIRPIYPFVPGSSMLDTSNTEWVWFGFGNSANFSDIYPNEIRYKKEETDDGVEDAEIENGTFTQYSTFWSNPDAVALRVEISSGGYWFRHNWYSDNLKGAYLKSNGKLYKILEHPTAQIIDVSITSVDGSSKFDPYANQNYSILNQKAWLITEHFSGYTNGLSQGIFKGDIVSVSYIPGSNQTQIFMNVLKDNFPTQATSPVGPKTIGITKLVRENPSGPIIEAQEEVPNSYLNRFKYKLNSVSGLVEKYKKFDKWLLWTENGTKYNYIISVVESEPTSTTLYNYAFEIFLDGDATDSVSVGDQAYISFDDAFETYRDVLSKEHGFNLSLEVQPGLTDAQGSVPPFIISNLLCINGEYRSNPYNLEIFPGDRIGITEGYLFGIEANGSASSQIDQLMLVSTPRSGRGVSALFHDLRQEDWVGYKDTVSGNLTIRKGSANFKEFPAKSEIIIGNMQSENMSGGFTDTITLNSSYQRLRRLILEVPEFTDGARTELLFGIGSIDNIHGIPISGDGIVDLQSFRRDGIAPDILPSSSFKDYDGNEVAPVVLYKKSSFQNLDKLPLDIAVDTTEYNTVKVINGLVSPVRADYANNNQVIDNPGILDLLRTEDGEILILYGKSVSEFNLLSGSSVYSVNNSTQSGNAWTNKNAVFAIGSFDDGYFWGAPFVLKTGQESLQPFEYPVMLMNGVDYLASIYDELNQTLVIFVRAFDSTKKAYIGVYRIYAKTVNHSLNPCQDPSYSSYSPSQSRLSFSWRPPLLTNDFIYNEDEFWTMNESVIDSQYIFDPTDSSTSGLIADEYYRILGPISSGSQIESGGEVGIISVGKLDDGTYVLFYDSEQGIRAIFSSSKGRVWVESGLIYARNGRAGLMLGRYLFYISDRGIEIKFTNKTDYSHDRTIATKKTEGINVGVLEVNMQDDLDAMDHFPIGSGPIEFQRLSGYITSDGVMKIFFYDINDKLKCMESKNVFDWKVADNF